MSTSNPYRGVVVPTITPFTPTGAIDVPAVQRVADLLIDGGAHGIFPLGTTGESASISAADKRNLVTATISAVANRAMVYVGISGNCFRESVELADACADLGVSAVVAHAPSYYPLSDAEIETYFLKLADRVKLPLILYNIPQTTRMNIAIDVVERLSKHPQIVAVKDSSPDKERIQSLLARTGGRGGFPVLLGNSSLFTLGLRAGGIGLIPSGAHVAGDQYTQMFNAAMNDRWDEVERLQSLTDAAVAPYAKMPMLGASLAKLKAILESRGICGRTMLPPLVDHVEPA